MEEKTPGSQIEERKKRKSEGSFRKERLFASSLQHVTDDPQKRLPTVWTKVDRGITDIAGALFNSTDHLNYQKFPFSCLHYAGLVTEFY